MGYTAWNLRLLHRIWNEPWDVKNYFLVYFNTNKIYPIEVAYWKKPMSQWKYSVWPSLAYFRRSGRRLKFTLFPWPEWHNIEWFMLLFLEVLSGHLCQCIIPNWPVSKWLALVTRKKLVPTRLSKLLYFENVHFGDCIHTNSPFQIESVFDATTGKQ